MHEDLNIKYEACSKADSDYLSLSSSVGENKLLQVYSVSVTDNNGSYIPAELWCEGEFEISVPVENKNVKFAGLDADGNITYYEPDSVENGVAVFTAAYPMSFAVVENVSADSNISVIKPSNDGTPIQTGAAMYNAALLTAVFAVVLIFSLRRRNKIG